MLIWSLSDGVWDGALGVHRAIHLRVRMRSGTSFNHCVRMGNNAPQAGLPISVYGDLFASQTDPKRAFSGLEILEFHAVPTAA